MATTHRKTALHKNETIIIIRRRLIKNLDKIKLIKEETGQMIILRDLLNQKHLKLLDATRYKLGKSKNEYLSCNLGTDTFCQKNCKGGTIIYV